MIQMISLMIVTDNYLFGECLSYKFATDRSFAVKDVVYTPEDTLYRVQSCQPEIVLIDSQLHHLMILQIIKVLTEGTPQVGKLLIGGSSSLDDIQTYIEAGVTGYQEKNIVLTGSKLPSSLLCVVKWLAHRTLRKRCLCGWLSWRKGDTEMRVKQLRFCRFEKWRLST